MICKPLKLTPNDSSFTQIVFIGSNDVLTVNFHQFDVTPKCSTLIPILYNASLKEDASLPSFIKFIQEKLEFNILSSEIHNASIYEI